MDAIITYVNGLDPIWRQDYDKYAFDRNFGKRFRDWGTLRYLLRGIETCMPFIRKVHLVVSAESQVPEWLDRSNVDVVLHSDIIPSEFLPTFNSTAIEPFIFKIRGLDEEFVYFNDDFFPMMPMREEDFFIDGKPCFKPSFKHFTFGNLYRIHTRNSDILARNAAGKKTCPFRFAKPQHTCAPMLVSLCREMYDKKEPDILQSITRVRETNNLGQYIYTDYMFHIGRYLPKRMSNKHLTLRTASIGKIVRFIEHPSRKIACINDVQLSQQEFEIYDKQLLEAFQKRFPQKSRFENQ